MQIQKFHYIFQKTLE